MNPYQTALRLLSYRWRSEKELRERLAKKNVPPDEIETTIRRLAGEGWIDDERFALEYVRSRSHRHGRRRIGSDLRRFGIEDEAVSSALDEKLSRGDENEVMRQAARKKLQSLSQRYGNAYTVSEVGRRKLARFLLNRGYPAAAVRRTVFELTGAPFDGAGTGSEERDE